MRRQKQSLECQGSHQKQEEVRVLEAPWNAKPAFQAAPPGTAGVRVVTRGSEDRVQVPVHHHGSLRLHLLEPTWNTSLRAPPAQTNPANTL